MDSLKRKLTDTVQINYIMGNGRIAVYTVILGMF
jgi:hypothetical protein